MIGIQKLPILQSVAINEVWEALLVGRPRHEDGGGHAAPLLMHLARAAQPQATLLCSDSSVSASERRKRLR